MVFVKWLRALFYIAIVSLVNSVVDYFPFIPASISTWVSRGIMAATVFCMLQLAWKNKRYQKTAIFRAVMLGCALITSFLFGSYLLTIAASIFSILAVYQEYSAHAELVAERNAALSRKWHKLFYWELAAAMLLSFGSTLAVFLLMSTDVQLDVSRISGMVTMLLKIPQFVIHVVRLLFLRKMIALFLTDEE